MKKVLFIPLTVGLGIVSGFISKPVFERVWALIDEEEPPDSSHRDVPWWKVMLAAALQGAIFRMSRQGVDRAFRQAMLSVTGVWPGEERPDRRP